MGLLDRDRVLPAIRRVSSRIRLLPRYPARADLLAALNERPRLRKAFTGAVLLAGALLAGLRAHAIARGEAIHDWLSEHPPAAAVWVHALGVRGFAPQTDIRLVQRVFRNLPTGTDAAGTIWATTDLRWIVVYGKPDDALPGAVFALDSSEPPRGWAPVGTGWPGFEALLATVDRVHPRARERATSPTARKRLEPRDPREIRY